jgi:hypothetical protein
LAVSDESALQFALEVTGGSGNGRSMRVPDWKEYL